MEKLEENFFSELIKKIKTNFAPSNSDSSKDDYMLSAEQEMMEEIVGYLQIELHDLKIRMQAASGDLDAVYSDTNKSYDKMKSVSQLIRDILASIKQFKTKSKDKRLGELVYASTVNRLHKVTEDTPIIEYEKILIAIAKDMLKIADYDRPEIEGNDDEDSAFEHYFRLFKLFPTKDFNLLMDLESGFAKTKEHASLKTNYETNLKRQFDKQNTKSTDVGNDVYSNEWKQDDDVYKFKKYVDEQIFTDFNKLWDEKFKYIWRENRAKEIEAERQKIAHIKETLLKEFTRE